MILFVIDLPLVSALNAYSIVTLCVCLYSDTENEELASVVQRQYDNMSNLIIVLNKLLFTIYGIIRWCITDFPNNILLTMGPLVS